MPYPHPFPDELAAVCTGTKPMLITGFAGHEIEDRHPRYRQLLRAAAAHDLVLMHIPRRLATKTRVFHDVPMIVVRREQLWRGFAFHMHHELLFDHGTWSQGFEAYRSYLLGYPDLAGWLARDRLVYPGGQIHVLLTPSQHASLAAVGMRGFTRESVAEPIVAFSIAEGHLAPTPAAKRQLGGFTLARVPLQPGKRWWRDTPRVRGEVAIGTITRRDMRVLNRDLKTKIELWTGKEWA